MVRRGCNVCGGEWGIVTLPSSGTKLFITVELKVFRHKERDTIFLCWLFHLPQTACGTRCKASASSESQPSSSKEKTQHTDFSQIPPQSSAHASGAWHHSHLLVLFPIWGFYFDICEWHILPAHPWTPALMLHLTNPCAKRKFLSLIKQKGKIYKTKSFGHYITNIRIGKASTVINISSIIWKSDLSDKIKRDFCASIGTTERLHSLDSIKTPGEKARCELHKNTTCCFEQIMKETPLKIAAVQPLTRYLSLSTTRQDLTQGQGEGKVRQEPWLEPCLTILVIDPLSAM